MHRQLNIKSVSTLTAALLVFSSFSCNVAQQRATTSTSSPTPSVAPVQVSPIKSQPAAILGKPYPGKGVVKLINRKEGWIEIDHEEIVDLMPAMEMEWFVEKPSLLNGLNVGDKVSFTIVETKEKGQILTSISKIRE